VLLDRPDVMMDQALSEHIMALHSGECGCNNLDLVLRTAVSTAIFWQLLVCDCPAPFVARTQCLAAGCSTCVQVKLHAAVMMQLMVACTDELMDQALSERIKALHSGEDDSKGAYFALAVGVPDLLCAQQ
jgi:hypothetical protein